MNELKEARLLMIKVTGTEHIDDGYCSGNEGEDVNYIFNVLLPSNINIKDPDDKSGSKTIFDTTVELCHNCCPDNTLDDVFGNYCNISTKWKVVIDVIVSDADVIRNMTERFRPDNDKHPHGLYCVINSFLIKLDMKLKPYEDYAVFDLQQL